MLDAQCLKPEAERPGRPSPARSLYTVHVDFVALSMPFVAILGAGDLGGALTSTLASRARFDRIRLIDPAGTVAVGKALDIRQAGPPDGSSTAVTGHADLDAAAGAWVVVLADPVAESARTPGQQVQWLGHAARMAPGALIVCAGAAHAPLLRLVVGAGLCAPDLLVGSAPAASAAAVRALVAAACRVSPVEVTAGLRPRPDATAPPVAIDWSRVAVRGRLAADHLTVETRERISEQLDNAWPPGPLTLGAATARVAEAAWFGSRRACPVWVADRSLRADAHALTEVTFDPGGRLRPAAPHDFPC